MSAVSEVASTRDRILSVALELFALKGYDATSMREIAERVGTTKAALYYHFSSKDEIVATLVGDLHHRLDELVVWARERSTMDELESLRNEVLLRWSDIVQAHGMRLFQFISANRYVLDKTQPKKARLRQTLEELQVILLPADATTEEQLRLRMAFASVNLASMVAVGIEAPDGEIFAAARAIAAEIMPVGGRQR